jgi:hypothetical protein
MRGKFKKIILIVLVLSFALEGGFLIGNTYIYCKHKVSKTTINGKIIAKLDNLINFSGMASK